MTRVWTFRRLIAAPFAACALAVSFSACMRVNVSRDRASAPSLDELRRAAPDSFLIAFETTRGRFDVMARSNWAPVGVDRLYHLVRLGYYDGIAFFRVVPNFVAQFGIHHDSAVNHAWRNRRLADDALCRGPRDAQVCQANKRGTIAYARGGAGTRTVQLFINLRDNVRLDTANTFGFAPIAEVVGGMDVVDSLYRGYGDAARPGDTSSTRRGPSQDSIRIRGYDYLRRRFPLLDYIRTARIVREWGGRPVAR